MRFLRLLSALIVVSIVVSAFVAGDFAAQAQSTEDAEQAANAARQRANAASGLVDEAVADREGIEIQLTESISRMNELAAELSRVGSDLDQVAAQVGYADVELAGIQADIEDQAVDAYMTIVSSPSAAVVNTGTVERALVAGSVVEDVVADGRLTVDQLFAKRKSLVELKETFLTDQEKYTSLQEQVDAEVENYTALFEQADATVADAIRDAEAAATAHRAALSAVEIVRAKEDERQRQASREDSRPTTSTTTPSGNSPPTTSPSTPTTTSPSPPTTSGGGGGGPWNHPPAVEQWRPLVQSYFPSNRVEEALAIIDCESNGDPNAENPYSGAAGLFQFLPSTWASASPQAGFGGYSVFDPEANIGSAAWLANRYQQLGQYYWQAWSCRRVLN